MQEYYLTRAQLEDQVMGQTDVRLLGNLNRFQSKYQSSAASLAGQEN
jgi:hypothetical protein